MQVILAVVAIAAASLLSSTTASQPRYGIVGSTNIGAAAHDFSAMPAMSLNPRLHHAFGDRPAECPPCFNCLLPSFTCAQYGLCNEYDGQCSCPDGFGGIDCTMPLDGSLADGKERHVREGNTSTCKPGWSGLTCNVCESNDVCKPLIPSSGSSMLGVTRSTSVFATADGDQEDQPDTAVCYKGGYGVKNVHAMCDVTNRKILDMLPDRPPQVTFSCDVDKASCGFQFWVGGLESFYCGLQDCSVTAEAGAKANVTNYQCGSIACSCMPGRMLCGEDGSVNIDDFLTEEIKGPGTFSCKSDGSGCKFTEPAMNQLINDIFGDEYITLQCDFGECMHYSMVPGFVKPEQPDNSKLLAVSIATTAAVVVAACLLFWYLGRISHSKGGFGRIRLHDSQDSEDVSRLLSQRIPASLHFADLSYTAPNGRQVLSNVTGSVMPGQLLAVMGASGAGKSTFLDIVAQKDKRGRVNGHILVNGSAMTGAKYRRITGFVDQEDTLLSTLTVYETVLYSALLRLPREMSLEAKRMRTLATLQELGILDIQDSRIGESGQRSISGGEKRRVSIACELVTSPSILFLDEPTSGLDAYNASNVIECLVNLAKSYERTVVFTIHQPRSNIVAMFDQLLLLAGGKVVYSGEYAKCQTYFESIGHSCPPGFNIADYLIDLTMQDEKQSTSTASGSSTLQDDGDEETAQTPRSTGFASQISGTELTSRKSRSLLGWIGDKATAVPEINVIGPQLTALINSYQSSDIADDLKSAQSQTVGARAAAASDIELLAGFKRASWWTQFTILSGRAFKNLYRNPMLMLSHYAVSIIVAILCSFLFAGVTNDIPGFQNRMGLFFFILALFGFSCLTSLDVFAKERILFMRERSNGYYSPFTYFTAKILFDTLPLRVIPPFILGAIIYRPVGLVATVPEFWKFILILILFNLATSSVIFFISIVVSNSGVANLLGSLVMLWNLLFAGLLVNRDKVPYGFGWLQTASFFHAAFEALLVNEVRYLQLVEHKFGVDIEVPAATILSMFGFRAQAFWTPDVIILSGYFGGFIVLAYIALVVFVKEKR